jgi:hypothetical protein
MLSPAVVKVGAVNVRYVRNKRIVITFKRCMTITKAKGVRMMSELEKINAFASDMLAGFSAVENDIDFISELTDHNLYYDFDRASYYLTRMKQYSAAYLYAYEREISNA